MNGKQAVFRVGNTTVHVSSEQFQQGYQAGYERFCRRYAVRDLTDLNVYTFIFANILDTYDTSFYNAGYITGWMAALFENQQGREASELVRGGSTR